MQDTVGIILMGGSGERFGSELPKQFHRLAGKKIYLHTLEKFLASALFEEILLVTHAKWIPEVEQDLLRYAGAPVRVVEGGTTRQESSYRGLLACSLATKIVVIHDAVRPFVSKKILQSNIEGAFTYGAVDTCIPSADTIVHSEAGVQIDRIPLRSAYLRGQTPQSFSYPVILEAHQAAQGKEASDDCSLVIQEQNPVHIVRGDERNIKITTEIDLFLADQLLRLEQIDLIPRAGSLKGKVFAITGGTGGIGNALASLLEKEGATPLSISRSSPRYPYDLSSYENVEQVFAKIHAEYGMLDGLINCMGMLKIKDLDTLSHAEIQELINVNLCGPIYCCKCAPLKENAHLVNVGSSSYSRGRKNYAIYSSAKAALVNFTQGLAEERPTLFVNAVIPGRTNTPMRQQHFPLQEQDRLLRPEQVAEAIVSLLKQDALTGSLIKI